MNTNNQEKIRRLLVDAVQALFPINSVDMGDLKEKPGMYTSEVAMKVGVILQLSPRITAGKIKKELERLGLDVSVTGIGFIHVHFPV